MRPSQIRQTTLFRAAVFDLDGTLADSLVDIQIAANRVLADFGHGQYDLDRFATLVGDGVRILFERALSPIHGPVDSLIDECIVKFDAYYSQQWTQNTCLYPGIREMLSGLVERGVSISVLSNKPDRFTKQIVDFLLHDVHVEPILGKRDGMPLKPDPIGINEIRHLLELSQSETVFVGDTNTDMMTGANAGVFTVGVTWGFRSRDELEATGADKIIDQPRQLLELFEI